MHFSSYHTIRNLVHLNHPQRANARTGATRRERTAIALEELGMFDPLSNDPGTHEVEAEVDSYLAVPNRVEMDTISFWEVCYIFNLINAY